MLRRELYKRKMRNNENYEDSMDLTSQDLLYITENSESQKGFERNYNQRNYDECCTNNIYSKYFEKYDKYSPSDDLISYNDYTASAKSYHLPRRRHKYDMSHESRSDELYNRHGSPMRYDYRKDSPTRDYSIEDFRRELSKNKKKLRHSRSSERNKYRFDDEFDRSDKRQRREQSSHRKRGYNELIHEAPEKENDYEQYFEKTGQRELSSLAHNKKNQIKVNDTDKAKVTPHSYKPKEYETYAYQEPRHNEDVFKNQMVHMPQKSSNTSEVEVQTDEWPLAAYGDPPKKDNRSDTMYIAVLNYDDNYNHKENTFEKNKTNTQVFVANLKDQHNIFQNYGDVSNDIAQEEPFLNSSRESPKNHKKMAIPSGLQYADSMVQSMIDKAVLNTQNSGNMTRKNGLAQKIPFTLNTTPFTYQVNVDILTNNTKESIKSGDKTVHGNFPVAKEYIKVSSLETNKNNIHASIKPFGDPKRGTVTEQSPRPSKTINTKRKSNDVVENKDSPLKRSITKLSTQDAPRIETEKKHRKSSTIENKQGSFVKQNSLNTTEGIGVKANLAAITLNAVKEETQGDNNLGVNKKSLQEEKIERNKVPISGTEDRKRKEPNLVEPSGVPYSKLCSLTQTMTKQDTKKQQSVDKGKLVPCLPADTINLEAKPASKIPNVNEIGRREINRISGVKNLPVHEVTKIDSKAKGSLISKRASEVRKNKENEIGSQIQSSKQEDKKKSSIQRNVIQDHSIAKKSRISGEKNVLNQIPPNLQESKEDLREFTLNIFQMDVDSVKSAENLFGQGTRASEVSKNQLPGKTEDKKITENKIDPEKIGKQNTLECKDSQSDELNTKKKPRTLKSLARTVSNLVKTKPKSHDNSSLPPSRDNDNPDVDNSSIKSVKKDKKPKTTSKTFSKPKSKDKLSDCGKKDSKNKPKKTKSLLSGILRKTKSKDNISTAPEKEDQNSQNLQRDGSPCQQLHITTYVRGAMTCAQFFLGTTLHQEIMDILKLLS